MYLTVLHLHKFKVYTSSFLLPLCIPFYKETDLSYHSKKTNNDKKDRVCQTNGSTGRKLMTER